MAYEIWDHETANIVAEFATEDGALDLVCVTVRAHGAVEVQPWVLAYEDEEGNTTSIATGDDLIHRAFRAVPSKQSTG